ncbi:MULTISPECIES: conjugative transposon protein TraJ [Chitinophagaceae]
MVPCSTYAQSGGVTAEVKGLQTVLDQLYDEMIPMCGQLIGVGRGLAGFGALAFIANKIWKHLANAEPIDFYPLLRPFGVGIAIACFSGVIGLIGGVMKPIVTATSEMVTNSDAAIEMLLKQKQAAVKSSASYEMFVGEDGSGDYAKWYSYTHNGDGVEKENWVDGIGNGMRFGMAKMSYNLRNSIKQWMSEVLQLVFAAAALCINTLRTFQLIVLAILGPLAFGLSVFDGFQHSLRQWLARYVNVFLWLPVCNVFGAIIGKIQENMLKLDISQINSNGDTFFSSTDTGYLIFLIIGIIGYFTVPSVAGFIVNAGGGGSLLSKVTSMSTSVAGGAVSGGATTAAQGASNMIAAGKYFNEGYSGENAGAGATSVIGNRIGHASSFMADKLRGGNSRKSSG